MDIYSKPIGDITYPDILAFLGARHPESRILDYKCDWIEHPVRVMAAFANTDGGIMLIGVAEEDKSGCPLSPPAGIDLGEGADAIKRQIESAAYDAVYPPLLPEVKVCPKDDDPRKVVVLVRVPESHQTPHWTDDRQRIYVRVQSQNRFTERQAYPEELQWLLDRRRAAIRLREAVLRRARERATLLRAAQGEPVAGQAVIETYAVPVFPHHPLADLAPLLRFARDTSVPGTVYQSAYNHFPCSSWCARPVAGGAAVTCSGERARLQQCIQIDAQGLLHSQLFISPDIRGEQRRLYVGWLVAPVDAFLRYLVRLCTAFERLRAKPMLLHASATLPELSRVVWMSDPFEENLPVADTKIELLQQTCSPRELEGAVDGLTRECARRVLWAGGYAFAGNEQYMDSAMRRLTGGQ